MTGEGDHETEPVRAKRLQSILKKWMDGAPLSFFKTIPKDDLLDSGIPRADLEKHGLISSDNSAAISIPQQCGKAEMVRILTSMFGNGKEIYKEQLNRAIKEGMHGWNAKQARFVTSQSIQWWRDNKSKTDGQLSAGAAAKSEREVIEMKRAKIALEDAEREHDAKWMMKEDASATTVEAVLRHHAVVKKQFDKKFSGIVSRHLSGGWTEEQLNKINIATIEAGREMMRLIEGDCAAS